VNAFGFELSKVRDTIARERRLSTYLCHVADSQ
jgi:hypothetical protein